MVRGMSNLSYNLGLADRVRDTWEAQDEWKKKLAKRSLYGGIAGKVGGSLLKKFGQKGLSSLMKKGLSLAFKGAAASNPWLKGLSILAPIVAGSVLKGVGTRGASKIYSMFDKTAKDKIKPTSDLHSSSWENLDKFREGIGQKERGAAYGAAAGDFVSGLKGEAAGKLSDLALGSQFGQSLQSKFQDYMNPGERESFKQSFGGGSPILNMTGEQPDIGSSVTAGGYNPLEQMQDMTSYESLSGEQGALMADALRGGAYSGFGLSNPNAMQGTDAQNWGQQLLAGAFGEQPLFAGGMQSGGSTLQRRSLMPGRNLGIGRDFESSLQDARMRSSMPEKGILSKLFGRKQDPRESFSSSLEELPSVLQGVTDDVRQGRLESAKERYEDKKVFDSNIDDVLQSIQGMKKDSSKLHSLHGYTPEFLENKFAQQAELEPMMNPFTGEELGEAAVNPKTGRLPTDAYRTMNKINRLGNPYSDMVSALERKESKEPERGILDKLIGRKTNYIDELEKRILDNPESYKVRESYREDDNWGDYSTGGGNTIGEMLGGRLLFGSPSDEVEVSDYRKNRLRELMGMQMGGMMPGGVSNALPYNMGGPVMKYNMGGSIGQQPLSYQLGGLLKYKRNPMVG